MFTVGKNRVNFDTTLPRTLPQKVRISPQEGFVITTTRVPCKLERRGPRIRLEGEITRDILCLGNILTRARFCETLIQDSDVCGSRQDRRE